MYSRAPRPKNLNLLTVKFPFSAVMSVGHRAAGIVLFLSLPYVLYLLQMSLASEAGFIQAQAELSGVWIKLIMTALVWALAHHFIAGIRYFLLDVDIGIDRQTAQKTALLVMILGVVITLWFVWYLFKS